MLYLAGIGSILGRRDRPRRRRAMAVGFGPGLAFAATKAEAAQQIATSKVLRIIGSLFHFCKLDSADRPSLRA